MLNKMFGQVPLKTLKTKAMTVSYGGPSAVVIWILNYIGYIKKWGRQEKRLSRTSKLAHPTSIFGNP